MQEVQPAFITGRGVVSAIGIGKDDFSVSLREGRQCFSLLKREHRQHAQSHFIGAEINTADLSAALVDYKDVIRTLSFSAKAALVAVDEAVSEANLAAVKSRDRIGIIIGGTNLQQRQWIGLQEHYQQKPHFLSPHYGFAYLDSDLLGVLTEAFNIQGESYVLGGASASGQMAIIHAVRLVQTGVLDTVIALGALSDLSYWECQGLTAIGAMAECPKNHSPVEICRPFDQAHRGFVFGEGCAAVVIDKASSRAFQQVVGAGVSIDANRNPNPSQAGQVRAIKTALTQARIMPKDVSYINTHGTASKIGDTTEVSTIKEVGCINARLNATKSLTGHTISAAGVLECVATSLQLQQDFLHGTRNLSHPIDNTLNWVQQMEPDVDVKTALNLSYGFSGINTALVLRNDH